MVCAGLPMTSRAKPTFSATVFFSSSRKSWKTQPIVRRSAGTFHRDSRPRSLPATWTRPRVGFSSFSSSRRKVDLPEPDGPMRKTNSPLSTLRLTSSRAGRALDG